MKNCIQFCSVILMFVFLASCRGQDQTEHQKSNPNNQRAPAESELHDDISVITDFNTITTPNAPKRITRKIRQDNEGDLLIAAYEDVIKYDGSVFTNFTNEAGLDSCDAFDVLQDRKGNIWIASTHLGVFRYDPSANLKPGGKSFTHFTTDDGIAHNRTMCLHEDTAGNIWIGSQGGASRYDGVTFRNFTTKEGLTHDDVNTIMEDKTGKIWIGTRGTACVYDPSTSTFTEIRNDDGKPFGNVWSIIEDKKGNIWLSSGGLWRYDGVSFTKITTESGICIYEDKKGNIWFNPGHTELDKSGLSRFDARSLLDDKPIATQIFKIEATFLGISEDKKGNIWVGGDDGVWRYEVSAEHAGGKAVTYFTGKEAKN